MEQEVLFMWFKGYSYCLVVMLVLPVLYYDTTYDLMDKHLLKLHQLANQAIAFISISCI